MIIQVTPRAMLNTFFRHRYKFTSVFLPCFGAALVYCLVSTPRYESDASLLVKFQASQTTQRADSLPSTGIAAAQLERQQILNNQIGVLQTQDILTDVLSTLTIKAIYPSYMDEPNPKLRMAAAVARLNKDLDVQAEKNANIIDLTLLHPDPEVAAKVLNTLIDKFVAMQSKLYQTGQTAFMEQQLEQARQRLEKSRAAVQAFKALTGIVSEDEERTLLLKQQSDARENLTQAISKQQEAQGRYLKIEDMLKSMPAQIKLSDENDRWKAVDDARQRVTDMLSRQKQLGDNYRADSQNMKTLNDQIAFAQQQLASVSTESAARIRTGANPVRQQAEVDLMVAASDQDGATASRVSYEAELVRTQQKLEKLEADSQHLNTLELQQQVDEENFRNYLQAVSDARVTDDLNRQRISSIVVVQTPTIPVTPSRPRIKLILAAGFLLGLAGAITVMLLAEMTDEAFSTADQIETLLGLPVLGTFTMRGRLKHRPVPAYVKLLPLLVMLVAAAVVVPRIALGFDRLDPGYGRGLVVRDQSGQASEYLYPQNGRFERTSRNGKNLGWATRVGSTLAFYNREGRETATARRELLPPNTGMGVLAVLRDLSGHPIGTIARD